MFIWRIDVAPQVLDHGREIRTGVGPVAVSQPRA